MTILNIDLRLIDVEMELSALDEHLDLIEQQLKDLKIKAKKILDTEIKEEGLTRNDPEWDCKQRDYEFQVDELYPRLFRCPFLISLYAVYESAVTEIAGLIQKKRGQSLSLNDIRGDFLDRAKKYYKHILNFVLCIDKTHWEQIVILAQLRHMLAHTHGRLEKRKDDARNKIRKWEKQGIGITLNGGFIIVDAAFANKTFTSVEASLRDLIKRYKEWDKTSGP